jgi:peptidoglycan hydrolase-like protein with peptidoglycan-binding domain
MKRAVLLSLVGVATLAALGSSSTATSSTSSPGSTKPPKPPKPPSTNTSPSSSSSGIPQLPPGSEVPESIIGRVVAALATGDPAKMRAEAKKLRKEGWPDQADDLEHAANLREEEIRAESHLPQLPSGSGSTSHPTTPATRPPVTVPSKTPKPPIRPNPSLPGAHETLPAGPRVLRLASPLMQGEDVRTWQEVLRADGFERVKLDGVYGPATELATREWQTDYGIQVDGIVGDITRGSVLKRPPIKLGARLLKLDSQGPAVKAWQAVLNDGGYRMPKAGVFNVGTQQATQAWQFERELTPDGIVGKNTLAKVGTAPAPLPAPKAALPLSAWRTLRQGMNGEDVRAWQGVLVSAGYPIKADGVFGPATFTSTVQWQNANGLRPGDGVVGANTRNKIPRSMLVSGDEIVSGDLQAHGIRAASPLPGILPMMQPDEVVEENRRLAAQLALHISEARPGKEDRELVHRYQVSEGLNATGNYGAATAASLVGYGIVPPHPFFWPKKERERTRERYRSTMQQQAERDPQRADEWLQAGNV